MNSLFDAAWQCLSADTLNDKLSLTHQRAAEFAQGTLLIPTDAPTPQPITMPGRPALPKLVHPNNLARRGFGTHEGKAAFLHAIAHIELNAIDLAWDAVYRFRDMPHAYYQDWVTVADDEARHFVLVRDRLLELGFDYGDFDAHNGLWDMAQKTATHGIERMAIVPRVLEARGLDVTPPMITKLREMGDESTAQILEIILEEEISHVAAGSRWFHWHCQQQNIEPRAHFRKLLNTYATSYLRGPFNHQARLEAGFDAEELANLEQAAN